MPVIFYIQDVYIELPVLYLNFEEFSSHYFSLSLSKMFLIFICVELRYLYFGYILPNRTLLFERGQHTNVEVNGISVSGELCRLLL